MVLICFGIFLVPFAKNGLTRNPEHSLAELNKGTPFGMLPTNSMNQRTSAHYIEINQRYFHDMLQIYKQKYDEIKAERDSLSREERLTKFNPQYQYVEFKKE